MKNPAARWMLSLSTTVENEFFSGKFGAYKKKSSIFYLNLRTPQNIKTA